MKIEKKWTASSKSEKTKRSEELVNMAGRWAIGIGVRIIKPYAYSKGPVELICKETHDREISSPPKTT